MDVLQIKQELGRYYIVAEYNVEEDEEYLTSMITENRILGHLPCRISFDEDKKVFLYDVTNMISLSKEYENKYLEYSEFKELFENISAVYNAGNAHLLEEQYYVLNPQHIYRDLETEELKLLYIPGYKNNAESRYYALADFFLHKVDKKDVVCIQAAYQFYRMTASDTFSISMFLSVIEKENTVIPVKETVKYEEELPDYEEEEEETINEEEHTIGALPVAVSIVLIMLVAAYYLKLKNTLYAMYAIIAAVIFAILTAICWLKVLFEIIEKKKEDKIVIPKKPVTVEEYWGDEETEILNEETVIINNMNEGFRLEWNEEGKERAFSINSFPIVIGKLKGDADCIINDSSISRLHAKIVRREGALYIFDLNSTNGTCVNGIRLSPGEEKQVNTDSSITLGRLELRLVC